MTQYKKARVAKFPDLGGPDGTSSSSLTQEALMGFNNTQFTQESVNKIIMQVRNARNGAFRAEAIGKLWGIVGKAVVDTVVANSYRLNSDFSLQGTSPQERRAKLLGDAYLVFYKAVMNFEPSFNVPFLAYVFQRTKWNLATDKRNNSKLDAREEKTIDNYEDLAGDLPCDTDIEGDCFRNDAIMTIERIAGTEKKLATYFNACREVCAAGLNCSDAEVARNLGCTRACTGLYRKKLVRLLAENGLDFDTLVATAA